MQYILCFVFDDIKMFQILKRGPLDIWFRWFSLIHNSAQHPPLHHSYPPFRYHLLKRKHQQLCKQKKQRTHIRATSSTINDKNILWTSPTAPLIYSPFARLQETAANTKKPKYMYTQKNVLNILRCAPQARIIDIIKRQINTLDTNSRQTG